MRVRVRVRACVLATTVLTGAFVYRYPLAAVFGISAMFAEVLCSWMGPRSKAAWLGCAVLFGAFLVNRLIPSTRFLGQPTPHQRIEAALDQVRSDTKNSSEPIVFSSPQLYLQYNHYAAAALRSRFVYAADPEAAIEFTSANSCDVSLIKLAPWSPARVTDYERFLAENSCFLVIHFTLVMNQAILGLALLAAKTESVERRFSKTSGGVH